LPEDEIDAVGEGAVALKNGRSASVTLHMIEGSSKEEIRQQLLRSLDAFFEFYPEI
jgi:hypothetical protein